ncbi:MAG: glycosyltransferase [Lentisphaerota bacterium]
MTEPGPSNKLTILSSTATGVVVPFTMMDLQQTLHKMGHKVLVQDNVALNSSDVAVVAITDGLVSQEPDLFATIDHVAVVPDVLAVLDRPPRVLSWFFDNPLQILRDDFLAINSHYHIFSWDRVYLPALKKAGYHNLYYQPFVTNPRVFKPEVPQHYDYDVSFVGTTSEKRIAGLMQLAASGIRIDIFGDESWVRVKHPNLIYHGAAANRTDCPLIYSRSRINLNITSDQLVTSLPVRFFDVLACEGFLLTDYRTDAEELFRPGGECVIYSSFQELTGLIHHYLEHERERNAIRTSGYTKVISQYTFDHVVPDMVEKTMAGRPSYVVNRPLTSDLWLRGLWLSGVSYMKFGKYRQAYPRLMDALTLKPDSPETLLAMGILANHIGQSSGVDSCTDRLMAIDPVAWRQVADELPRMTEMGKKVQWWQALYRLVYPKLFVRPEDGTIPGWEPHSMER